MGEVRRFGQIIKVKPEGKADYIAHHANPMPGVNEMIKKYQTEHNSNIPVWYEKAEAYFMSQKEYYKKMIT